MRISTEVRENLSWTAKRRLGVDDPFIALCLIKAPTKTGWVGKGCKSAGEAQVPTVEGCLQVLQEKTPVDS